MAERLMRTAVKRRLVEVLGDLAELKGVEVTYAWHPHLAPEHVFADGVSGSRRSVEPETIGGRHRRDEFVVSLLVGVFGRGDDVERAEERVEEIVGAVESYLTDDDTLGDLDGLQWAVVVEVEGPRTDETGEGPLSWARVGVECRAHLT